MKGITTMTSSRLVGLVRIGLVAASLAFAGGVTIGAGPVAAGEPELKVRSTIVYQGVERPSGLQFDSRCPGLKRLATGASAAGDARQAHDFRQEAMDLGCL